IFTFILLACFGVVYAQKYYYTVTKTFNEDGYTYQCNVSTSKFFTLYNKASRFISVRQQYKDGRPLDEKFHNMPRTYYVKDDSWTKPKCYSIVNNAFASFDKNRLRGEELMILLYIDSTTGKVADVEFNFVTVNPFSTVPLSIYRNIELEIKKHIYFIPTPEGNKLNFLFHFWEQEIE
ncbi:MAG: DUF5043 domain-containing protein, partial [Bacteroides sp.]